mgnify:CR=1 FL=1
MCDIFSKYKYIFWDFDGVIKDSIQVKSDAFATLFSSFGNEIEQRVREHHEDHGGMSRYDKIPLYLEWAKQDATQAMVKNHCDQFSNLVTQAVIDSPWVHGVQDFLCQHSTEKSFFLLTATPQEEIEEILQLQETVAIGTKFAINQISSWYQFINWCS